AQEGFKVNYGIYREDSTNTSYIVRDSNESSTTTMKLSARIAYSVNDFRKDYVEGASAVIPYSTDGDSDLVESNISIYTTDKTVTDSVVNRSTIFITQENASRLTALGEGIDYVFMSDIHLDKIDGLENGWKPVSFPSNSTLDGNNFRIFFNETGFDLTDKPTNIGMFTNIPSGSVIKNLQIVVEHGATAESVTVVTADLKDYEDTAVNVGFLAGVNNGIVTNTAILSEWQFDLRSLTEIINPVTGTKFTTSLPFNKDGYLFDDKYFYELNETGDEIKRVYNALGYAVEMNGNFDQVIYDEYRNVQHWIYPDRTAVARYEDYSPIRSLKDISIDSESAAKFYVYANNDQLSVTLGGLVGTNSYMITNSRVLIDVELYGPAHSTEAGKIDDVNVRSSTVGGFVGINNGTVTSSYYRDGTVTNNANANTIKDTNNVSLLGGFVGYNNGTVQQSYAMGRSTDREKNINHISTAGAVKTIRNSLGGFTHLNNGTITDCLVNMVIYKTGTEGKAGGFVYQNTSKGKISNCIENNNIILQSGGTLDFYAPFVAINNDSDTGKVVDTTNLSNLIYAGNAESNSISGDWAGTLKRLTNNDVNKYDDFSNYEGFSMGQNDNEQTVSTKNTVWVMTNLGPMLRAANEITISFRKYTWESSPYLYAPGSAENPYLVWNEDQFNDYIYGATAQATQADKDAGTGELKDIETSRQDNHIRLVDNVALSGIKDTYKIIYTGTLEGNGLTMSGISLDTVTNDLATMGLFGKTEYATIRNINFKIGNINSTARYVGGIAGIAINTSFVDVKVANNKTSDEIKGANIVGGFAGLNVVNDPTVENYNLNSSVSVTANFHNGQTDVGAKPFASGKEYVQQTLYAKVEALNISYEQGFGTAGAVFGYITSNPNYYRVFDEKGHEEIKERVFEKTIQLTSGGEELASEDCQSYNTEKDWFLKDSMGNVDNSGKYYTEHIVLRNVSGNVNMVSANVAGGLIGIMDETIELRKPDLISLSGLSGKYYLGGIVGINLGKISGGVDTEYETMNLKNWSVSSSAGQSFIFRDNPSTETANTRFWGMTVGAVAGYNDGFAINQNSGVIENIHVNVDVLSSNSKLQYIVGGIVGANGEYGYVKNAVNTNSSVNISNIQVDRTQAQKIGFYFGQIVGYGRASKRMDLLQVDVPDNNYGYVDATAFETPDYNVGGVKNAFGVVANETLKVQTMTLEEYKTYLSKTITGKDLVTRIEMLDPWVRSLPTEIGTTIIDGKTYYVERFNSDAKEALLTWIEDEDNAIFETWDPTHSVLKGKVYDDFVSYLTYSAISTEFITSQNENEFKAKLEEYRATRYQMALEFFKYQYQVTEKGISGKQNADFSWAQYEAYLTYKQNPVGTKNFTVEFNEQDITVKEYETVRSLLNALEEGKEFTNKDPLQIYLNYVVQSSYESKPFILNDYRMNLEQYYYYNANLYGQTYQYEGKTYEVPGNFKATESNGYLAYLHLNNTFEDLGSSKLTIPEFIYMMASEGKIVMQNETAWIKTGHIGAESARISTIGAVELDWVGSIKELEFEKVVADETDVVYYDKTWNAMANYTTAKSLYGLTIAKYKEIIALGGSLYELTKEGGAYENLGSDATDTYIFALKAEQYDWKDEQIEFIKNYYGNQDGYDLQYALAATTYGRVVNVGNGNVRAVYQTAAQELKENQWYADDGDGELTTKDPQGIWYFPAGEDVKFTNGDGQEYYFWKDEAILLGGDGAAMYIDDGNKMFGTVKGINGGSADTRDAGSDILLMYEVANADEADFYQKDNNGKVTGYFKIARQIVENSIVFSDETNEGSGNKSDYLEEALWWRNQGFTAEGFDQIKAHAMTKSSDAVVTKNSVYTSRATGYTLADDWYAGSYKSFSTGKDAEKFTPAEYVEIVLGAKYDDGVWYSNYADYLLFVELYDATSTGLTSLEKRKQVLYNMIPGGETLFKYPFIINVGNLKVDNSKDFIENIASENELADAMDFNSYRDAFLAMFRAKGSTANYVVWAQEFKLENELQYFRLNHYIYYIKNNLDKDENFIAADLQWALIQEVRAQIMYYGVTQEDRTEDLVTYRCDWYNDGTPFITFRDYC
ncbi:MAG: hypothetical protein IJ295_02215, partial [Clostridia bacterium]|nr:hypothetical protein [Clostridia bacterium]